MFEIELINNDEKVSVNGNNVDIADAYCHSFSLVAKLDGKRTNIYRCITLNNLEWITIKKETEELNGDIYTIFDLYVSDNYSEYDRSLILQLQNDVDGSFVFIEIKQNACDYKIVVDGNEDETEVDLNKINEFTDIKVQVYGASKKMTLQQSFIEIVKNGESIDYDRSLYFYLKPDVENSTLEYNEYTLKVKCLGDFKSLETFVYQVPIVHYNNQNCVFNLTLKPKFDSKQDEDKVLETITDEYEKINTVETISKRNELNKVSNMEESIMPFANDIMLFDMYSERPKLDPISDIVINGNIIELQTNTYNYNNDVVHDSMVVVMPKALWCMASSEYRNGKHYIKVTCQKNYWDSERKALLKIKNAENTSKTETFVVIQTPDNQINIENPNQ